LRRREINNHFFECDLLSVSKRLGLSLQDLEEIPYSMFQDMAIREFGLLDDATKGKSSKPVESIRIATQHDMDLL